MPCFSSFYLGGSELLIPVLKFSPLGIFSRSEYQEKVNAAMHLLLENTVGTVSKTLPGLGCGIQQRSCVSSTYRGLLKLKVKILLQKEPEGQVSVSQGSGAPLGVWVCSLPHSSHLPHTQGPWPALPPLRAFMSFQMFPLESFAKHFIVNQKYKKLIATRISNQRVDFKLLHFEIILIWEGLGDFWW